MPKNPTFRLILASAIVAAAAFSAPRAFTPEVRSDSALDISSDWCNPASRKHLMASQAVVAQAKTEVRPLHNRIDTGRPLPDDTSDAPLWSDPGDHHIRVTALEPERL